MNDSNKSKEEVQKLISELLVNSSLDSFSYSGIYTLNFTLSKMYKNIEYCSLDIALGFSIYDAKNNHTSSEIGSLFGIWSKSVTEVSLDKSNNLLINFGDNYRCNVLTQGNEAENTLVDLSWTIYDSKDNLNGLSVWAEPRNNIFVRNT